RMLDPETKHFFARLDPEAKERLRVRAIDEFIRLPFGEALFVDAPLVQELVAIRLEVGLGETNIEVRATIRGQSPTERTAQFLDLLVPEFPNSVFVGGTNGRHLRSRVGVGAGERRQTRREDES